MRTLGKLRFSIFCFLLSAFAQAAIINVPTGSDPVANGTAFQTAMNSAQCGDTIILQAGAIYQGPHIADQAFLLPNKGACSDFITIQTSNLAGISASGVRINPAIHAAAMPKLVSDTSIFGGCVVGAQVYANHYKLIGLEITSNGGSYGPNLVNIKSATGSGPGGYPTYQENLGTHDFIIDRCFIHSAEISATNLFPSTVDRTSGRGVNLEGVNNSVINSYIAGLSGQFPGSGYNIDSYGIVAVAGPGPLHIVNNYIEAQFNNIFTGGGDNHTLNTGMVTNSTLNSAMFSNVNNLRVGDLVAFQSAASTPHPWETGQVTAINGNSVSFTLLRGSYASPLIAPDNGGTARWNGINISNVEIRRNTLNKPDAWNAFSNPKAYIEIKDCVNCVIDGNYMYSGIGTTIALTPRNQGGSAPWAKIENLIFTNNIMVGYKWGIGAQGSDNEQPSVPSGNWTIRNNLWYSPKSFGGAVALALGNGYTSGHDISFIHNTIVSPDHIVAASSVTTGQFILKDNIVNNGQYGVQCYIPPLTFQACFPNFAMTGNVIVGAPRYEGTYCTDQGGQVYPPGNHCIDSASQVGFVDPASGNYRLSASSPFKGQASDATDPGVDMDALEAAMGGVTTPPPASRCDVNTDTHVDAVDLQRLVNAILALTTDPAYDLDSSGQANAVDVQLLANVILLIRSCP